MSQNVIRASDSTSSETGYNIIHARAELMDTSGITTLADEDDQES